MGRRTLGGNDACAQFIEGTRRNLIPCQSLAPCPAPRCCWESRIRHYGKSIRALLSTVREVAIHRNARCSFSCGLRDKRECSVRGIHRRRSAAPHSRPSIVPPARLFRRNVLEARGYRRLAETDASPSPVARSIQNQDQSLVSPHPNSTTAWSVRTPPIWPRHIPARSTVRCSTRRARGASALSMSQVSPSPAESRRGTGRAQHRPSLEEVRLQAQTWRPLITAGAAVRAAQR